jgi:cysteine desulfurase
MSIKAKIYLDANAGLPLKPAASQAILSLFAHGGAFSHLESDFLIPNPSSIHSHGRLAKRAVAEARESIARSLGSQVDPEQLVMTSSGTESNQLAIRSVLEARLRAGQKPHWITTTVEHDSARQLVDWLMQRGGAVTELAVDAEGRLQAEGLSDLIRPETALVSLVWVNNETGVILDVEGVAQVVARFGVPLHLDAAQAWGKLPFDVDRLGASYVSFSGHKVGGLAGTGVLWVARGKQMDAVILGKQEKGRRGGTENTLGLIALGAASGELDPVGWAERVQPLRDELERAICARIPGAYVNGGHAPRVANTLNLNFEGIERDGLVMALDLAGFSVSAGSACSSGVLEPSHVLRAMGRTDLQAMAALRVSLVDSVQPSDLHGFVESLEAAVSRMRRAVGFNLIKGSTRDFN